MSHGAHGGGHGHKAKKKEIKFPWAGILSWCFVIWGFSTGGTASTIICIIIILAADLIPLLTETLMDLARLMIAAAEKSATKKDGESHHSTDHHHDHH